MRRSNRRRQRRLVATPEVQCPRCLYVAAHLRGGYLRIICRWALAVAVAAVFLADMVTQQHRSIGHLTQAAPVLAVLALASLLLPGPSLYCSRCEQQKAKRKSEGTGAAA